MPERFCVQFQQVRRAPIADGLGPRRYDEADMSKQFDALRDDAMNLPDEERARLAKDLLGSLGADDDDASAESAWRAELRHRLETLDDHRSARVEPTELQARVQERLSKLNR